MYNVYLIKTDIKVKANTFLNINILAEDLSDAISSASYIKYNGEKLNDALNEYGNIPVTMLISEIASEMNIEDIQADEESVTLCNF